ncbi:uncharacterized protein LTR77_008046 [Saxophila tyrrhenica]|uniref:Aminotransferase class I/classII large domain-containing protein n=1 Tax=Saxophila tyrrhenica TaxID=1690608 RepID=A0AAV9P1Q4_9PEZI|nr:hypothetical protein LTR77_008046 [Saxophila tyrrhenica]
MASAQAAASMTPSMSSDKPAPPKDLSNHFSRSAKARTASSIKQFYKYFQIPGIGQLAGGLPNNHYFPYDTLEAKVARPDRWDPTPNKPVDPPPEGDDAAQSFSKLNVSSKQSSQSSILVPHTSADTNPQTKVDLSTALQYGTAQGYPPLYGFLRQLTRENLHPNCPYEGGPEIILTCGNTDGFCKVLQLLTNEWSAEKDWVRDRQGLLVEKFAYMNAIQAARPRGLNVVPVEIDDEGMIAEGKGGLREVLENWDYRKGKRPSLIYTVTMGQNPTSGVLSLQRRRELYAICCEYDVIICEDDPYWYLQFPTATAVNTTTTSDPANTSFNPDQPMFANAEPVPEGWKSSGYKFLDSLVPSSISIDTEGRVIRLDTFSKTVAPGCRLGWITCQPAFVERILRISETSTQQPSGFVQSMIAELLLGPDSRDVATSQRTKKDNSTPGEAWDAAGWVRWIEGLRGNYERRMNQMAKILDSGKYLVKSGRRNSLADPTASSDDDEWSVVEKTQTMSFDFPVGGMFLWLRVHFENHPLYHHYAKHNQLSRLSRAMWIFWTTKPYRVLVSPGTIFSPTQKIMDEEGWRYFRLCFAAIDEDMLKEVTERLRDGVNGFFRVKDRKVVEKLLEEDEAGVAAREAEGEGLVSVAGFGGC